MNAAAKVAVHLCIAWHTNPGFAFADFTVAGSMLCLPELLRCRLALCVLPDGPRCAIWESCR